MAIMIMFVALDVEAKPRDAVVGGGGTGDRRRRGGASRAVVPMYGVYAAVGDARGEVDGARGAPGPVFTEMFISHPKLSVFCNFL